jgi:hypothetical protein
MWERMVLESLAQKEKTTQELGQDTSIAPSLLKNILKDLMQRNILDEKTGVFKIKGELSFGNELVQEEVKDVLLHLLDFIIKINLQLNLKKFF